MRRVEMLCASLALLVFVGCSAVIVEEPVGLTPVSDVDEWVGSWVLRSPSEEPVVGFLEVVDAENAVLQATWLERDDPKVTRVYLREAGGWTFASIPFPGSGDSSGYNFGLNEQIDPAQETEYVWARVSHEDGVIMVWVPDVDSFRRLVTYGAVPGRPTGDSESASGDPVLGRLEPEHYAFLASDRAGVPFVWDEPMVFTRMAQ